MKRWTAILLMTVLVFSLVACGGKSEKAGNANGAGAPADAGEREGVWFSMGNTAYNVVGGTINETIAKMVKNGIRVNNYSQPKGIFNEEGYPVVLTDEEYSERGYGGYWVDLRIIPFEHSETKEIITAYEFEFKSAGDNRFETMHGITDTSTVEDAKAVEGSLPSMLTWKYWYTAEAGFSDADYECILIYLDDQLLDFSAYEEEAMKIVEAAKADEAYVFPATWMYPSGQVASRFQTIGEDENRQKLITLILALADAQAKLESGEIGSICEVTYRYWGDYGNIDVGLTLYGLEYKEAP